MAKLMKIAQTGFVAFAMMIWTVNAIAVTPQGNVVFKDGANVLCTVPLNNGAATCSTSSLSVGSHSITATYSGVTSSAVNQVVNTPPPPVNAYFAANGRDSNPCTQAAPCLTLDKASAMSYPPGSTINFRGGDSFTGCWFLDPTNVPTGGISSNPIIIQSYGTGRATWIANCPGRLQALFVSSQVSGVIIQNLKLSAGGTQTAVGIGIEGPGDTIIARDIEVSGFNYNLNGNWGGEILVVGLGSFRTGGCNALNNVQVINSQLHGEQGATSPDAFGIYGFGCGSNISNAVYKGNTVYNIGSYTNAPAAASGNGIVANSVSVGEVSYNLIHDIGGNTNTCGGPTGIMTWNADRIVVQFNEVYNVAPVVDQGGCDFVGIDFDGGTTNSIAQYNYTHDNAGAAWMICCGAGDGNVIRYNISQNDDKYYKSGGVVTASDVVFKIYNNTIWIPPVGTDPNHAQACYVFGFSGTFPVGALIANNICYTGSPNQWGAAWYADSGGQVPPDIANVEFIHNLYNDGGLWHINSGVYHSLPEVLAIGKEAGSVVSDPKVTNPGGGGTCAWDPTQHNGPQPCPAAYRLLTGSPGLDAGVDLQAAPYNLNVGTRDYYGNPITTTPNIGADQ